MCGMRSGTCIWSNSDLDAQWMLLKDSQVICIGEAQSFQLNKCFILLHFSNCYYLSSRLLRVHWSGMVLMIS